MKLLLINNFTKLEEELKIALNKYKIDVVNFDQIYLDDVKNYDVIILSGSRFSLPNHKEDFSKEIELIKESERPILGICFGFQLICHAYGCELKKLNQSEKSVLNLKIIKSDEIFDGINSLKVFEHHKWVVKKVRNLIPLAKSKDGIEIIKHPKKMIYGFQFHPEISLENNDGPRLLSNFLKLCKSKKI